MTAPREVLWLRLVLVILAVFWLLPVALSVAALGGVGGLTSRVAGTAIDNRLGLVLALVFCGLTGALAAQATRPSPTVFALILGLVALWVVGSVPQGLGALLPGVLLLLLLARPEVRGFYLRRTGGSAPAS